MHLVDPLVMRHVPRERRDDVATRGRARRDFVRYDIYGNKESVVCRYCETPIVGWRDVGATVHEQVATDENGKPIHKVVVRQRFGKLQTYAAPVFRLSDGSIMTPPMCTDCVNEVTVEDWDSIMDSELYAMIEEIVKAGKNPDDYVGVIERIAGLKIFRKEK